MLTHQSIEKKLKKEFSTRPVTKRNQVNSYRIPFRYPIYQEFFASTHLWMRPIFPDDYTSMIDAFSDPVNMRYWGIGTTFDTEATKNLILRHANNTLKARTENGHLKTNEACTWAIITHEGIAGCFFVYKSAETEIGYVIRPSFAGRGITTEAGQLILNNKFFTPMFSGTIFATVHPNNFASQKVLIKLGLKPDPVRQNVSKYNSVRNYYHLTVLPEDENDALLFYSFNQFKKKGTAHLCESGNTNANNAIVKTYM